MDEQTLERLTAFYGLDQPVLTQYLTYLGNLLQGDLGYSFRHPGRTVNEIIATNFPVSMDLGLRAIAVSYPIGILLGAVAAKNRGKPADFMCVVFAIVGVSIPSFVLASMMQWIFGVQLGVLPVAFWRGPAYAVLPVITLSMARIAGNTRGMRANFLEAMSQDYSVTAKAKGLSEPEITMKHQFRNSILPMITGLGPDLAAIVLGSMIVEQIFVLPGLGLYFVQAIQALDYTMVMGITIFYGTILVFLNFLVDLSYGLIDPRIRIHEAAAK
jgi:oligopeptide transport system permease protein